MTRDNEKRSGAGAQPPASALSSPESETQTLTLTFPEPTELVDLPSKGKFYPVGHPLRDVEQVEIRHMTAKEEDILTNVSLIKKGVAIDRMLQNVVKSPKFKVEDMLAGDKNALTVAARITGFGPQYKTKVQCPACTEIQEHEFDLNEAMDESEHRELPENASVTENGTFIISDLPRCPYSIEVRLMTGRDEQALTKSSEKKKKHNMSQTLVTDQMKMVIVAVNGVTDNGQINKFVESMPLVTAKAFKDTYKQLTPNIDLTQSFECSACGNQELMEVPFSTEFFWPK